MEIELSKEIKEKIEKYIEEGRYKDMNDFLKQAAEIMIMAEDRKAMFQKIIKTK